MNEAEPQKKKVDPLIEEVRAVRKDVSERFGNDVNRLCDYLLELQAQYKDRIKRPAKVPPVRGSVQNP